MSPPSLRELQVGVMRAVLEGAVITPARRLDVHVQTAFRNFHDSLASSFPAVRRLVGEAYFEQCARGYQRRRPCRSGDLQPAGEEFAAFLEGLHGDDEYRYLGEVARLEWLIQEALLGAEHPGLDLARLREVAPEDYEELRFELHPTARLFSSAYPCLDIWEANVQSESEPETIDLGGGADRLALVRYRGGLTFHRLTEGEESFLRRLQAGQNLGSALEAGLGVGGLDPGVALRRFVLAGIVADLR